MFRETKYQLNNNYSEYDPRLKAHVIQVNEDFILDKESLKQIKSNIRKTNRIDQIREIQNPFYSPKQGNQTDQNLLEIKAHFRDKYGHPNQQLKKLLNNNSMNYMGQRNMHEYLETDQGQSKYSRNNSNDSFKGRINQLSSKGSVINYLEDNLPVYEQQQIRKIRLNQEPSLHPNQSYNKYDFSQYGSPQNNSIKHNNSSVYKFYEQGIGRQHSDFRSPIYNLNDQRSLLRSRNSSNKRTIINASQFKRNQEGKSFQLKRNRVFLANQCQFKINLDQLIIPHHLGITGQICYDLEIRIELNGQQVQFFDDRNLVIQILEKQEFQIENQKVYFSQIYEALYDSISVENKLFNQGYNVWLFFKFYQNTYRNENLDKIGWFAMPLYTEQYIQEKQFHENKQAKFNLGNFNCNLFTFPFPNQFPVQEQKETQMQLHFQLL